MFLELLGDGESVTTLGAAAVTTAGVVIVALISYFGTRTHRPPPTAATPEDLEIARLQLRVDRLTAALTQSRELLLRHDIEPPPYPDLDAP